MDDKRKPKEAREGREESKDKAAGRHKKERQTER